MTTYIAVAAGAVFLTVVVGMIIPEGKLHTSVNFVLRIACIFILISPLAQIFDISLSEGGEGDVDFDYICQVYSEGQSSQLEKLIEENKIQILVITDKQDSIQGVIHLHTLITAGIKS